MPSRIRRVVLSFVLLVSSFAVAELPGGGLGVDANYALDMAVRGKTWSSDGKAVDPFVALADAGCRAMRVRVWVGDDGMNRPNYAIDTAKRAQSAGLKPYVVLFLSDDWADFVKQPVPKVWAALSDADKAVAVETYAEQVARRFADAGVEVDTFEIGNEIDFGICGVFEEAWPNRVSVDYMRSKIWPRMTPILAAAQRGVIKARPKAKFVLHLTQWNNAAYCGAFFRFMIESGVKIDFAGLSYFPTSAADAGQRSFEFLRTQVAAISEAVQRPVLICETGYPAAANFGGPFADWNKPADGYALTPEGQAKWTANFAAFVRDEPRLAGAYYWSPEWHGGGLWDAFAWFNDKGEARPVLAAITPPTTRPAATRPAAATLTTNVPAGANGKQIYFGNLHAHTGASDGTGTAEEAFAFARDTAGLDFIAVTDHNHLLGGEKATPTARVKLYDEIKAAADAAMRPGTFVALYGQEYSSMSKGNHVNAFDVPAVIDVPNGKFDGLLEWLGRHKDSTDAPAVIMFNHPGLGGAPNRESKVEFGRDDFGDDAGWVKNMGPVTHLVELLNGEPGPKDPPRRAPQNFESHYRRLLRLGFRVAPAGNQDNHKKQWGTITDVRTGVIANELTKPALLAALRARHVYASEDKNLRITVAVNDGLCGDAVKTAGPLKVLIRIEDPDEFATRYTVEAVRGRVGGREETITPVATIDGNTPPGQWAAIEGVSLDAPGDWVFFRITQSGAQGVDKLWTAPVWRAE